MRSAKKHSFSKSRIHFKQKIENWPSYNRALKNRARLDFMVSANLSEFWYAENNDYKKRGRQKEYSDLAMSNLLRLGVYSV